MPNNKPKILVMGATGQVGKGVGVAPLLVTTHRRRVSGLKLWQKEVRENTRRGNHHEH
jgi:hypothetical protein